MGCDLIASSGTVNSPAFQSTHPHGVRRVYDQSMSAMRAFQSTHPHGVRLQRVFFSLFGSVFQSTHPHGVRLYLFGSVLIPAIYFNPRTRMGCDIISQPGGHNMKIFQSTHPHGVRPAAERDMIPDGAIFQSTHPHGVRRRQRFTRIHLPRISIHAPAWGATSTLCSPSISLLFQSTHPHGVRRKERAAAYRLPDISIHAPAWGATIGSFYAFSGSVYFNPRTRMGCDGGA